MLSPTKTEDRQRRWWHWQRDNCPGRLFVVLSCLVSSAPSTLPHRFSLLLFLYSLGVTPSFLFLSSLTLSSNLSSGSSGGGELGDKSVGSWGVLGKPKARRRSTGLLRRAVIILVTCYRRACSSVYLQLLLPLGAHFNAWGWLLCNEFRNTGSRCKKRRETREARNHWPITNRSARKKNQGRKENVGHRKCRRTRQKASVFFWTRQFFFPVPMSCHSRAYKSPQSEQQFLKWCTAQLIQYSSKWLLTWSRLYLF